MPGKLGNYIVKRTLGEGATCKTKLGVDQNGKQVAIKIIKPEIMSNPSMRSVIMAEVDSMTEMKKH